MGMSLDSGNEGCVEHVDSGNEGCVVCVDSGNEFRQWECGMCSTCRQWE